MAQPERVARALSSSLAGMLFFAAVAMSLFLTEEITWDSVLFALAKGALAMAGGWLFFSMVCDAAVKTISTSASRAGATRREGGLIFHLLPPDPDEIIETEPEVTDEKKPKQLK